MCVCLGGDIVLNGGGGGGYVHNYISPAMESC